MLIIKKISCFYLGEVEEWGKNRFSACFFVNKGDFPCLTMIYVIIRYNKIPFMCITSFLYVLNRKI